MACCHSSFKPISKTIWHSTVIHLFVFDHDELNNFHISMKWITRIIAAQAVQYHDPWKRHQWFHVAQILSHSNEMKYERKSCNKMSFITINDGDKVGSRNTNNVHIIVKWITGKSYSKQYCVLHIFIHIASHFVLRDEVLATIWNTKSYIIHVIIQTYIIHTIIQILGCEVKAKPCNRRKID